MQRLSKVLAIAIVGATATSACTSPTSSNCADPGVSCRAPEPPAGSYLINDFEALTAPARTAAVGCADLYAGETCTMPLRNKLGQCADSLFCAYGGSVCGSTVQGTAAFRGNQSWRLRFNESLIPDASTAISDPGVDGGALVSPYQYPFSGYSERLSSTLGQGPGCDASLPSFNAERYSFLTFWTKVEAGVDFEVALKSDRPTANDPNYPESFPKVSFTDCQQWSPSCVSSKFGDWRKVSIPLTKLEAAATGIRVDLSKLVEINIAFAARPYVTDRHERGAAEIIIDDISFEPASAASGR